MTTIAYRDGVMAGDSRVSSGGTTMGTVVKVVRRADGALFGACGAASHIRALVEWFLTGETGDRPAIKDNEAQAIIARRSGRQVEWHDDCGHHVLNAPFFAIGSGRDFALGAMGMGASAEEAVKVAARFDSATGGRIVSVGHAP